MILIKTEIVGQEEGSMDNALAVNCEDCSSGAGKLCKCGKSVVSICNASTWQAGVGTPLDQPEVVSSVEEIL